MTRMPMDEPRPGQVWERDDERRTVVEFAYCGGMEFDFVRYRSNQHDREMCPNLGQWSRWAEGATLAEEQRA